MTTARLFFANCLIWLLMLASPAGAGAVTMADLQTGVGDLKENSDLVDGGLGAALLHGGIGCAANAAFDGSCASGFAVSFGTELIAGQLSVDFEADPNMDARAQEAARMAFEQNRAALIGAFAGYITSGGNAVNVNQGASVARSAVANNRQLHIVEVELIERYADEFAVAQGYCADAATCPDDALSQARAELAAAGIGLVDELGDARTLNVEAVDEARAFLAALSQTAEAQAFAAEGGLPDDQTLFSATPAQFRSQSLNIEHLAVAADLYAEVASFGLVSGSNPVVGDPGATSLSTVMLGEAFAEVADGSTYLLDLAAEHPAVAISLLAELGTGYAAFAQENVYSTTPMATMLGVARVIDALPAAQQEGAALAFWENRTGRSLTTLELAELRSSTGWQQALGMGAAAMALHLEDRFGSGPSIAVPVTGRTVVDADAPKGTGRNLDGFSDVEVGIINEADGILSSSQMNTIRQAYENGESVTVVINGRTIQYEPDLPASGMTMFGEDGFLIGREAFSNPGELDRTVLHELHRLTTSQSASGVSGSLATNETQAAFDFANQAFEAMNP